jgi:hypothetical protein
MLVLTVSKVCTGADIADIPILNSRSNIEILVLTSKMRRELHVQFAMSAGFIWKQKRSNGALQFHYDALVTIPRLPCALRWPFKERNSTKSLCVLILSLTSVAGAMAQTNVGVSIGINQPGVYGQINIGNYPPPRVINQQPVLIVQSPVREPLYMYVPPGHQKHWEKHCRSYNACGRPVYFVREDWVQERYAGDHHGHDGQDDGQRRRKDERKRHKHEDN